MSARWRSSDQAQSARTLDVFASSLQALDSPTATYWADGFRLIARKLEAAGSATERRSIYRHVGRMLRGGMGSVNDLYSEDPGTHGAFQAARHDMHRVFGLGFARSMLDDTLLGRADWYR